MSDNFLKKSDGTFTLSETNDKNLFLFYRNDGGLIDDVNDILREFLDLYESYWAEKMISGEVTTDIVHQNLHGELSCDRSCVRITTIDIPPKKDSFFKRLLHKIFG